MLKQQTFLFSRFQRPEVRVKMAADLLSSEASPWLADGVHLLDVSSHGLFCACVPAPGVPILSHQDTRQIG